MSMQLIDLINDFVFVFVTAFYSILYVYSYLCCVQW